MKEEITAEEARRLSNQILKPVKESSEFEAVMNSIFRSIKEAVKAGKEKVVVYAPALRAFGFPGCVNSDAIDRDGFWWPYVEEEVKRLGYRVSDTMTSREYAIRW